MRAPLATILAAVAVALASAPAHADDVEAAAQVHLDRGIAAYGAGDLALAKKELLAAVDLVPHKPNPYRWRALAAIQDGDCAHAKLDVDSFLARVAADDPRIPELVRARDACKQKGVPQIVPRPEPIQPVPPAPPPREERSIATRWWFWTALGAGAVAITGAVLFATRDDGPTELPAIRCDASGCR
jgi:hypothetical protein